MSRARTPLRASSRPAAISSAGSFTRYSRVASPAMDAVRGGSRARRGAAFDEDANPPRGIVGTGWYPGADDARLAALAAARAAFLNARILDVARCPHDEAFITVWFSRNEMSPSTSYKQPLRRGSTTPPRSLSRRYSPLASRAHF